MAKKFLTLNIGYSAIALAEYESSGASLTMVNYGTASLAAPLDAGNADTVLSPALLEIVREKGIKPGPVAVSLSGQMVFPRFAAIPDSGSDQGKFDQLVRYEIEQNIPFPIDEMICDRQVLGDTANGDKAVLIVAAKTEQVEAITDAVQAAGFQPMLVDAAPIAVTNALKANRGDEGCVMVLDIGAKTASLIIAEDEKLYNRSIPIAGNTITKEIAQALGCTLEEAEGIKRECAYVSMGGVTEDEDETLDRLSKVCRAVLTRLHAEVSRSINFYRSQQGGGVPTKLYLTGGSALLPQIDAFFRDSLQIEVEFLNPFERISLGAGVDAEAVEADAAVLSATAGVALHAAGQATIAITLMPASLLDARAEVARIPFVGAAALLFVVALVCVLLGFKHDVAVEEAKFEAIQGEVSQLQSNQRRIESATADLNAKEAAAAELKGLIQRRSVLGPRFNAICQALGDELWVEKWEQVKKTVTQPVDTSKPGKRRAEPVTTEVIVRRVTIRGWKDDIANFVKKAAAKSEGESKTASMIVAEKLRENSAIVAESVKVIESSDFGKDGCVEQFVVEMQFK